MPNINWESFENYNKDSRGINFKFEDLCRQLFMNEFVSKGAEQHYLHANPNNPGLETEPVCIDGKRIGFQAKYFAENVSYSEIFSSAEMIVKHYQGEIDYVYFYCNKPLTRSSCEKTFKLLKDAEIETELVTDNAILDLVRKPGYAYLANYYFGNHSISIDWIKENMNIALDGLGARFNRQFNIDTKASEMLSLFVRDDDAVEFTNKKIMTLLSEIDSCRLRHSNHDDYLLNLRAAVVELGNISIETLPDCLNWYDCVIGEVNEQYRALCNCLSDKEVDMQATYNNAFRMNDVLSKDEIEEAKRKYYTLREEVQILQKLIGLPEILKLTTDEEGVLKHKILFIDGNAGCGKTQLLANEISTLLNTNRCCLFIAAGTLLSNDQIEFQITKKLNQEYTFEELLDILNAEGERTNRIIPICVDALNETWNLKLWADRLPYITAQIQTRDYLRLVISYRSEYEKALIKDTIFNDEVSIIHHNGFIDNSVDAIKTFLNEYNIAFTPDAYFIQGFSNPLFLTLYCKTYNGNEINLQDLYESVINQANQGLFNVFGQVLSIKGYNEGDNIVGPFIDEFAEWCVANKKKFISTSELSSFAYWNNYSLSMPKFMELLSRENIFYDTENDGEKSFYFAYDQMNDYFLARKIIRNHATKEELIEFLKKEVLLLGDGVLGSYKNIGLFVMSCALFADKYGVECIDIIDEIADEEDRHYLFGYYIKSFQWRSSAGINVESFISNVKKYGCLPEDLWQVLICNSTKVNNPLNANFLHRILMSYPINRRDYLWTLYINDLTYDEPNRLVQLIEDINRGINIEMESDKQYELLLTLIAWMLTSSNRKIRDCASKAMIEVLKNHFSLCIELLKKFAGVNDPYVKQRLLGVVFGACCKRTHADGLKDVAEYIYDTIFNQAEVYPDILLRDYARLIIERYLYEEPNYSEKIEKCHIVPPYVSEPIPEVAECEYDCDKLGSGENQIVWSMKFEGMGVYGDFGRYVYQSALRDFNVDDRKIYDYSLEYIFNTLGYKEEWFGEYDRRRGSYNRSSTLKIERIGKKYQWITMYNVLARVSDNCKKLKPFSSCENEGIKFEGAWDPYVRDFDPTLNINFMMCDDAPVFIQLESFIQETREKDAFIDVSNEQKQEEWLANSECFFIKNIKDTCLLVDDSGVEWIALTKYIDTGRNDLKNDKILVWSWMYAYFVTNQQLETIREYMQKGQPIINSSISSHCETYTVYNREYPWSPACDEIKEYAWIDAEINTGDFEKEVIEMPDIQWCDDIMDSSSDVLESVHLQTKIIERPITENLGRMLHSTTGLLWEEEYDASKSETLSHDVPCFKILEDMKLKELESDGFYYDSDNKLAAFDTKLTQHLGGVVIRKDVLIEFLRQNNLKLIWIVDLQKEIHAEGTYISKYSEYEGLLAFGDDGCISGDITYMGIKG